MAKVRGDNVLVEIYNGTAWQAYACATSCTLETQTSVLETAVPGTGAFATFVAAKNSATGSFDGFVTLGLVGQYSIKDIRQLQLDQEVLQVRYRRTDGTNTYTDTFQCIITGVSDSAQTDNVASFNVNFQITGAITIS